MTHTHDTTTATVTPASGSPASESPDRTARVADEAVRWAAFAAGRSRMRPETVYAKAVHAAAFSAAHRAVHLAIPTKLSGTSKYQAALWALVRDPVAPWAELEIELGDGAPVVSHGDGVLGHIQAKHVPWLRPLLPFGARVHLGRVTGSEHAHYVLGLNAALAVGEALDRLLDALGDDAPPSGDGLTATAVPGLRLATRHGVAVPVEGTTTSAATEADGVPVLPEHAALARDADPRDVVLWRSIDGAPHASVPVSGTIGWGPRAAPEAARTLAHAVLTTASGRTTADALADRFTEVVRRLPHAGGVVRLASVRLWITRTTPGQGA